MHISSAPRPPQGGPRVALLDDFDGDPQGFPHGQAVESVLLSHSTLQPTDVVRIQNEPPVADLKEIIETNHLGFSTGFRTMTARNLANFYKTTAENLRALPPGVQVVSQSQGESSARQLKMVIDGLKSNEEYRNNVARALGVEPDLGKICQELINDAEAINGKDPHVLEYRREYLQAARALYDRGVEYLVAAGNDGPLAAELAKLGVECPIAFKNVLACEYNTVVGATDAQGQPSFLNSPNVNIEAWAVGEDLAWTAGDQHGVNSGTSFAAPIVAGQVIAKLDENPALTPFELEAQLKGIESYRVRPGESKSTSQGQTLTGDGRLEPFIAERIGEGFYTDVSSADATQLAQATQESTFFALPGQRDPEFQLVRVGPDPDGKRQLTVQTYFEGGLHVLRAQAQDGAWDPATVVEELHLGKNV